ncbi:MAG: hypothetical protein NPINA01_19990 [Nitrospinaceae bacterium]|nr:MAG: hypothetical protein NPINA01_19990 [Nitrospinaceae bacterium]
MKIHSRFILLVCISWVVSAAFIPIYNPTLSAQEKSPNCDPSLAKLGKRIQIYEVIRGKLPEKLSDLYIHQFVKEFGDFQCMPSEDPIELQEEIEENSHFELLPDPKPGDREPVLVTKSTVGTPRRAFLRNGEIINWGEEEAPPSAQIIERPRPQELSNLDRELLDAVKKGDLDRVRQAISDGANANAQGKDGSNPLGKAASGGYLEIVKTLIQAGADANWEAPRGQTALNVAAGMGNSDVLQALIEAGADVNQKIKSNEAPKRYQGATPIFIAAEFDRSETLRVLIDSGSNVNAVNKLGMTPLLMASLSDNLRALLTLIEAGADVNAKTTGVVEPSGPPKDSTALMGAAINGNLRTVQVLLLAGAEVDAENGDGKTALQYASEKDRTEIVRLLQQPLKAKNLAKQSMEQDLVDILESEETELLKGLLRLGLNPNIRDKNGKFILIKAMEHSSLDTIKALVEAGANVNVLDPKYGATPLMFAAAEGRNDIVKLLIQSGAEINVKSGVGFEDEGGWTALMAAAMEGHAQVVAELLSGGADPKAVNSSGKTALDIAKKENNPDVVRLLEKSL